jgi:hypothetical protein
MARCDFAKWRPLPENSTQGRIDPTQAILHTAVDAPGETDLYGFFARGDITVESHFFIQFDGDIIQYMDTGVRADANRDANGRAISIETEDDGAPEQRPWSDAQIVSIKRLLRWIHETHPKVPLTQCVAWDAPGIGWHAMWGAPSRWTPSAGKTCPGSVRIAQTKQIIATLAAPDIEGILMALTDAEQTEMVERIRAMHIGNWVSASGQGDLSFLTKALKEAVAPLVVRLEAIEAKVGQAAPTNGGVLVGEALVRLEIQ